MIATEQAASSPASAGDRVERLKLVFLNRSYWPDTEATGQLLTDLSINLALTHDVHIVCGAPNSPATSDYVKVGTENRQGVWIHRVRHSRFSKRIPAGRLLNLLSFTASASWYLRRKKIPADVLICETDPFLLPLVASSHQKRVGGKLICYLQDIYPDVAESIGKISNGSLSRLIRRMLRTVYSASDQVIVLGRCMKTRLVSEPWNLDPQKMSVITNWSDCAKVKPMPKQENRFRHQHQLEDKFVVMHSGNMGLTQQLDLLIQATQNPHWPEDRSS